MSDEAQQRLRQICRLSWRNTEEILANFLSQNEVENLSIRAGTLTAAGARSSTIISTLPIKMLDSLPWPAQLKNVTEYAEGTTSAWTARDIRMVSRANRCRCRRDDGHSRCFRSAYRQDRPYQKRQTPHRVAHHTRQVQTRRAYIDPDLLMYLSAKKCISTTLSNFFRPSKSTNVDLSKDPGRELGL